MKFSEMEFSKEKFNNLLECGDLSALLYLEMFIPKEFETEFDVVLKLNYINNLVEQNEVNIPNFYDIYAECRDNLLEKLNIL